MAANQLPVKQSVAPAKNVAVIDPARYAKLVREISVPANDSAIRDAIYFETLVRLQCELVKLQRWVHAKKLSLVVIFEGRDAAGKGGVLKRVVERLDPRHCHVAALGTPTERERRQWYFQRYVSHLPAAGEIAFFDRSWYNRAGVERVMGFCSDEEYEEFLETAPQFEQMLIRSGIILIKYWFSISFGEQRRRLQERLQNPLKQWKLSPMDIESLRRWDRYTEAKETMFARTHTHAAPWWIVDADDKRKARLNCIRHLLAQIPYRDLPGTSLTLPERQTVENGRRRTSSAFYVPQSY
ncbi:MAG: polyphosphate kinase 2 [Rhodomicrobium sp.]